MDKFQTMKEGHFRPVSIAKYREELTVVQQKTVHCASYRPEQSHENLKNP